MKPTVHCSAQPSHYNQEAEYYDEFNEKTSQKINKIIETILKKHKVQTILDLTCGTGSQVFWLARRGFAVQGSDINAKMLAVAKSKAKKANLKLNFSKGDMRTAQMGQFDAVITIFNAIGHLTKADFEKAIRNIHQNLNTGGLYIFDIFNLSYLIKGDRITKLTIDWLENTGKTQIREIQYSTINLEGILASYTTSIEQEADKRPKASRSSQTLQIYSAKQIQEMLLKNGFKVVSQVNIDGTKFSENNSERILTIAKKA